MSHLQRGTSDLLRGLKEVCFEGLLHPEIAPDSNYDLESHLVLNSLATACVANKSHLVFAQSVLSIPDLIVCKLYCCLYFLYLATNLLRPSIEPLNNIITI